MTLNQQWKIYNNDGHILLIFLSLFQAYDCTAVFKLYLGSLDTSHKKPQFSNLGA